jgi:hypothetical protein
VSAINWISPKLGGRRPTKTQSPLAFRVANHKGGKVGGDKLQGVVYVYPLAMKALRWQIGDRVMIGTSADKNDIYLRRVATGGYSLSPQGGDKTKKKLGTFSCAMVKTSQIQFRCAADIPPDDYIVMDDGIVMFSLKGQP